jgi:type II secretory pathway component PulC
VKLPSSLNWKKYLQLFTKVLFKRADILLKGNKGAGQERSDDE